MSIVIVNDILGGCLGEEKVFWNYMLDSIDGLIGLDCKSLNCSRPVLENEARKRVESMGPDTVIIQNATFLGKISNKHKTVAFLQDNLRAMNRFDAAQENVIKTSQHVVFNSKETAKSYKEFTNSTIIPIGIDSELFSIKNNKQQLKEKYGIPASVKIGIFVGSFNDVKGWNEVKSIIERRKDIFFICVTKHKETYQSSNCKSFSLIDQRTIAELHNCSDFFILGSPVETQCLAAIEAGFCGLPIIMKETGIFMDLPIETRNKIGRFNNNLNLALESYLSGFDSDVRSQFLNMDFSIHSMVEKWKKLLISI